MGLAKSKLEWPKFDAVCDLTLEKVVLRLLLPLQSEGRTLKPCLLHGNCWDGNTAMDRRTDEAFVFDVCSFYGHSRYRSLEPFYLPSCCGTQPRKLGLSHFCACTV